MCIRDSTFTGLSLQEADVLRERLASEEHLRSDVLEVFAEPLDFLLDLVGQLFDVGDDHCGAWVWIRLSKSLQDG